MGVETINVVVVVVVDNIHARFVKPLMRVEIMNTNR